MTLQVLYVDWDRNTDGREVTCRRRDVCKSKAAAYHHAQAVCAETGERVLSLWTACWVEVVYMDAPGSSQDL